jgi:hypothetical protein
VTRSGRLLPGWAVALVVVSVVGTAVTAGTAGYAGGRAVAGFLALVEEALAPSGPALPPSPGQDSLPG